MKCGHGGGGGVKLQLIVCCVPGNETRGINLEVRKVW